MAIINGRWVSLDRFPHPKEPDEFVVTKDWQGEEIWNYYGDKYFLTEDGYVHEDDAYLYLSEVYQPPQMITEWEDE